jgi:hypothetical protein
MKDFKEYLKGNDLRSIGNNEKIMKLIHSQKDFDKLFSYLYNENRNIRMKAIDIIEKVTVEEKNYLKKYKNEFIEFTENNNDIEFKWHLAQLLSRLEYNNKEIKFVWKELKKWALDTKESKIVRVNSLQSLYELKNNTQKFESEFMDIIKHLKTENIPSINSRIKKIKL